MDVTDLVQTRALMESASFEDFYRAHFDRVFEAAYAFSGQREIAQDVTQDAFSRAFARWRRPGRQTWAAGWVMTTALNSCRRQSRMSRPILPPPPSERGPSPDRVALLTALRSLPERQRQATVLQYIGDLPVAAVAELMGLSEGAVKAHLSKARTALRTSLEVPE
jgi:RNA polymerase sigma-70 factor, ECF subfamily